MDERLRILEMVRDGKVTPEDGMRLLDELDRTPRDVSRTVKVLIKDPSGRKVQFALPAGIARTIVPLVPDHIRAKLEARGIRLDDLLRGVQEGGALGQIVDIRDPSGAVVEVIVE